jgi:AcrR family transcriptional regulator
MLRHMARDAHATRLRLLDAATAEFAEHGIAGARVDRVAAAAGCNKALIYSYFGNKDQLFEAVFARDIAEFYEMVPFDTADLPGYAGRLFDHYETHPVTLRLSTWYRLERADVAMPAVSGVNSVRLERLRQAQADGFVPGHFDPVQLLVLLQAVPAAWATTNPELLASSSRELRRRTVVEAVRKLLA